MGIASVVGSLLPNLAKFAPVMFGAKMIENLGESIIEGGAEIVKQKMPNLFGIGTTDESILAVVETALERHYPGDIMYVSLIQGKLPEEKRKRWRLIITGIGIDSLTRVETQVTGRTATDQIIGYGGPGPSGPISLRRRQNENRQQQGEPIIGKTVEEKLTATKVEIELSKEDPRVLHLHYVASLVKAKVGALTETDSGYQQALDTGIASAVQYLNVTFLDDTPFYKLVWKFMTDNAPKAAGALKSVHNQAYHFLAKEILGQSDYDRIMQRRGISSKKKELILGQAVDYKVNRMMLRRENKRSHLAVHWPKYSLAVMLAVIVAAGFTLS